MSTRRKLRDAVTETKTIKYDVRPELYARVCDCCDRTFQMNCAPGAGKDDGIGILKGCWNECYSRDGRGGNTFSFNVCSIECATTLATGGWRKVKGYKNWPNRIRMASMKICVTSDVLSEEEIISIWEQEERTIGDNFREHITTRNGITFSAM